MTTRCLNVRQNLRHHLHPRRPGIAPGQFSILALLLAAFVGLAPVPIRAAQNLPAQGQPMHRLSMHGAQLPPGLAGVLSQKGLVAAAEVRQISQQQELLGAPGDFFGNSVALSANGQVALVGAASKDGGKGAVYVFQEQDGIWTQQQELHASDGAPGDSFGYGVSLSAGGNVAIVGAVNKDGGKGAAYVFQERGGIWTQQQELHASDGVYGDSFGFSLALSAGGNVAIVGAVSFYGTHQGAAYVFQEQDGIWTQQQELHASDGAPSDNFGYTVALSAGGNMAIVGAVQGAYPASRQGAAYVFQERGGIWTQQQELHASDGDFDNEFGVSVALSAGGNVAIVGADAKDVYQGAAYVFQQQGGVWTQQQELRASDGVSFDSFGYSVSLNSSGNIALVGAYGRDDGNGAAFVFQERGGAWTQQQEVQPADGANDYSFGIVVALSANGHVALVGSPYKGAAYVFANDDGR